MAGFKGDAPLSLQQGHLVTRFGQIPGAGYPNHAATENHYLHIVFP